MIYDNDGQTREVVIGDLEPGVVLRMVNPDGSVAPFMDCVITNVIRSFKNTTVQVSRVFAHVNVVTHGDYVSIERFEVTDSGLKQFRTVLLASGEPYKV